MSLRSACEVGVPAQKWNTTLENSNKRVFPENTDDCKNIPSAAKKVCREDTDTSITSIDPADDAFGMKEYNTKAEFKTLQEEGQPYVRTRIPKPTSTKIDSDDDSDDGPEHTLGQDYIVQASPTNVKYSIEQKFLLEMPQDFFDFWEFCTKINEDKPEEALIKAGLTLVGPYDVLTGKLKKLKTRLVSAYVCHWRYYYDPPEFMTVIAGDDNDYHIGYFRDDPFHMPVFIASMSNVKPGNIKPLGGNIFAAVCSYLNHRMKEENPFRKTPLQRLHREIETYARSHNYTLDVATATMRRRRKKIYATTFHGAGLVLPGRCLDYKDIHDTNDDLRQRLQRVSDARTEEEKMKSLEDMRELITNAQSAYDERDYGTGLELGMNLFINGGEEFHKAVFQLLSVGYDSLGREPFVDIIHAHLQNRRRGSNMSILEVLE